MYTRRKKKEKEQELVKSQASNKHCQADIPSPTPREINDTQGNSDSESFTSDICLIDDLDIPIA